MSDNSQKHYHINVHLPLYNQKTAQISYGRGTETSRSIKSYIGTIRHSHVEIMFMPQK